MDVAAQLGLFVGAIVIALAVTTGSDLTIIVNLPGFMIVAGGSSPEPPGRDPHFGGAIEPHRGVFLLGVTNGAEARIRTADLLITNQT